MEFDEYMNLDIYIHELSFFEFKGFKIFKIFFVNSKSSIYVNFILFKPINQRYPLLFTTD